MSADLRRERQRSKLNVEQLTNVFDGGEDVTNKRRMMVDVVKSDPVFDISRRHFMSREEALVNAAKRSMGFVKHMRKMDLVPESLKGRFLMLALNDELPVNLQHVMFIPTLESQGTDEQRKKWLPLALNYKILGAYAQTELGHGTFIRGLETTATYDPNTEEFVMNSPTLTAIKWWPGALGHFSTHAVVVAKLITKGKDHGIHHFVVQLRSLEDHTPLPGVTVGDVGPKFGYKFNDNGFLKLDNVRIPREHMLMRHSKVEKDGTYITPPADRLSYGTMVFVRSTLTRYASDALSRCATIATRYSAVRRQTKIKEGEPEVQILDFITQQYNLFPQIATAYALRFAGNNMLRMYVVARGEMEEGNIEALPELHATSAVLKAFSTEIACKGMELCRLSCGGHGYSDASGFPFIYSNFTAAQTYEGENTVMYLQAARYLLKLYEQKLNSSSLPSNVQYLAADYRSHFRSAVQNVDQWLDPHNQLEAYRERARRMVRRAATLYRQHISAGEHPTDAWNHSSLDWIAAAKAHSHLTVVKYFIEVLNIYDLTAENEEILKSLCDLYAVHGIVEYAAEFMNEGYLDTSQVELARKQIYKLLKVIREEAVPLVDAFDHSDYILDSCLGCYDGNVYEKMYNWARSAPTNQKKVFDGYDLYMKDWLKAKL